MRKLKSLIEVPYVTRLKVQVLRFNMNLISSRQRVPRPSYQFRLKFGRSGKGSFTEKGKIIDRASLSSAPESTSSKLHYEPCLFTVACTQTELTNSGKIGKFGKGSSTEKAKIVDRGSLCSEPESTGCKLQCEPYVFSVVCSQKNLSISENNLGDQAKDRSPKKVRSLIEIPYVALQKVQFPSFNINLFSSPQRDPSPSSPFWGNLGGQVKGRSQKKAKIVDRASLSSAPESTCSKLQYDPFLFSVACSQTQLYISGEFG